MIVNDLVNPQPCFLPDHLRYNEVETQVLSQTVAMLIDDCPSSLIICSITSSIITIGHSSLLTDSLPVTCKHSSALINARHPHHLPIFILHSLESPATIICHHLNMTVSHPFQHMQLTLFLNDHHISTPLTILQLPSPLITTQFQ